MNIQLPDKFYKFLVFLSIILMVFIYMKSSENSKIEINSIHYRNSLVDSLEISTLKEKQAKEKLIDYAAILSARNNIKNPIRVSKDSTVHFNRIITSENKKAVEINDLINVEWNKFENQQYKTLLLLKRLGQAKEENEIANKLFDDEYFWLLIFLSIVSGILFWEGIKSWYIQEKEVRETRKDKNLLIFDRCQSCYKKFSTIRNYSKNKNQSINYSFCNECYDNGKFTEKYKTVEDVFEEINLANMKENESKYLKNNVAKLDRWKLNEY